MGKGKKLFGRIVAGILAVVIIIVAALQIVLSGKVLTPIAMKYLPSMVEGEVRLGEISGSLISSFPHLRVNVDDLVLTYPHDKFSRYDSLGIDGRLLHAGRGERVDTLAELGKLSLSINPFALLRGEYHLPMARFSGLRLYAHYYDSTAANWHIISFLAPNPDDTTSSGLPTISLDRLSFEDKPRIVFTDQTDTIYAFVGLNELNFKGVIEEDFLHNFGKERHRRERLSLSLDDLHITGRMPADTLAASFKHLALFEHKDHVDLNLSAEAMLFTQAFGRMKVPIDLDMELGFPKVDDGSLRVELLELDTKLSSLPIEAKGDFIIKTDSTYVKLDADIKDCPLGSLLSEYGGNFTEIANDVQTDAVISLNVNADGWYVPKYDRVPKVTAHLEVPSSTFSYTDLIDDGEFDLDFDASLNGDGVLDATANDFCLKFKGLDLMMSGSAEDLLGEDPLFDVTAFFCTEFSDLMRFLPEDSGIQASGDVDLELDGKARLSQLNLYNFSKTSLTGRVFSDNLMLAMPDSGLYAVIAQPDIRLETTDKGVALVASIDSLRFSASDTYIKGSGLSLKARNDGAILSGDGKIQPLRADLNVESLNMLSTDSMTVALRNSANKIIISRVADSDSIRPHYSWTSGNDAGYISMPSLGRATIQNLDLSASAQARVRSRHRQRQETPEMLRRRAMMDSLQRLHPAASRDSLMAMLGTPDFLSEKEFRLHDISFDLGESVTSLLKNWRPDASISVGAANLVTPLLPLRNRVNGLELTLNDDELDIDRLQLTSGSSHLGLNAKLTGLRPVLMGRSAPLNLDAQIYSKRLNLNELIAAAYTGSQLADSTYSFAEGDESFITDTLENAQTQLAYSLFVVPANLNADVKLQVDSLDYSYFSIGQLSTDVAVRERCIQLTNTMATSAYGDVAFDGFYSTKTKKDITAGFNLGLNDITAERVIEVIPAIDSLVPMLSSFKGLLNCELAATTQLDTNMNVLLPTLNGIVKLGGENLELEDSKSLRKIAKLLMFKDTKVSRIDEMSINGIIANNQLEVFPFILSVDRYTLGLNGLQQFDSNFRYHVSVIKSPLPFKFGINLKGNFDDWHYQLCKAKYKSTKLPVYTSQINDIQINLATSIKDIFRKGVDLALRETTSAAHNLKSDSEKDDLALTAEEGDDDMLSAEEMSQMDAYMAETELERQSEELEAELDDMFDDMFTPEALSALTQDSKSQKEEEKAVKQAEKEQAAAEKSAAKAASKSSKADARAESARAKVLARQKASKKD